MTTSQRLLLGFGTLSLLLLVMCLAAIVQARGIETFAFAVLVMGVAVAAATSLAVGRDVVGGERDAAEQAERLRTTLASIGDAVITTDTAGRVTNLNPVAEALTGWRSSEAVGKPLEDVFRIVNEATRLAVECPATRALRDGVVVGLANHTILVAKDGTERPIDDSAAPIRRTDGQVIGCVLVFRDVSERHAAEAALRESEERSAFVRRSSGVGFWYCDLPFDVLQWDDLVKAHFHLPLDAVVTIELFYDRIHPDDREPTRSAIERSIATRTTYNVDYRTVNPESGAEKWIRAIGRTFYDADGAPTRFDGVTLDVTDQKRSEERQAFLIRLADTLRPLCDPVVVQAEASRVLGEHFRANRVAYFEIRGDEYVVERDYAVGVETLVGRYPVAAFGSVLLTELLNGRTFVEADATTTADRLESEQAAFAALQVRGHVDVPLVKDGRFVAGLTVHHAERREWSREEVALIEETAERTWAAIERVRAEAALRQSEERRRLALDAAEMGAWHIDPATSTLHSDDRFRVIFTGAAEDPITYEQAFAAIHPNDRERIRQAVAAATQPDAPLPYAEEYRVVHADGTVRWVFGKGRANFERGGAGRLVSFDGTVADVTARKRIEEERERLLAQLREAGRRKDEFLATLAHELRNPLAPIRNGLQVLKMTDQREIEEQARSMMERQLDQMVRLVDDLLDVSRITQGKLELRKERVTLEAVLNSAIETSRGLIDQMEHEFTATLPGHSIVLEADLTRLSQVFSNLLNNAAKYSEPGGKISLRAEREGNHVAVSVKDAGIGIAPDQLPRLFEMFSQLDRSLEKSQGGLGIGLSLVKGLVEMHNGVVEARSDGPGRGSEFTVRLPLVAEESNPLHQSSPRAAATLQSALRILIVDDNRDGADSLAAMMQLMGNVTRTAYDGEDAVAAAADFQPDVILLDIGLPKLNGYDACRRIRSAQGERPIVIIAQTGWGAEADRQRTTSAGFDHHLVKPVDPAALMALIAGFTVR